MRLLHYSMEHRADYPWQFVTGNTCTLRLWRKYNTYFAAAVPASMILICPGS